MSTMKIRQERNAGWRTGLWSFRCLKCDEYLTAPGWEWTTKLAVDHHLTHEIPKGGFSVDGKDTHASGNQ